MSENRAFDVLFHLGSHQLSLYSSVLLLFPFFNTTICTVLKILLSTFATCAWSHSGFRQAHASLCRSWYNWTLSQQGITHSSHVLWTMCIHAHTLTHTHNPPNAPWHAQTERNESNTHLHNSLKWSCWRNQFCPSALNKNINSGWILNIHLGLPKEYHEQLKRWIFWQCTKQEVFALRRNLIWDTCTI